MADGGRFRGQKKDEPDTRQEDKQTGQHFRILKIKLMNVRLLRFILFIHGACTFFYNNVCYYVPIYSLFKDPREIHT